MQNIKQRNLVQKHVMTFNRPTVFKDRKKYSRKVILSIRLDLSRRLNETIHQFSKRYFKEWYSKR